MSIAATSLQDCNDAVLLVFNTRTLSCVLTDNTVLFLLSLVKVSFLFCSFFFCFSSKRINNLYSIFKRDQICIEVIIRFRSRKDTFMYSALVHTSSLFQEKKRESSVRIQL